MIYFYANIDLTNLSKNFKMVCKELVFALVNENEDDCIVSYLDLELDIIRIEATTKNVEHKSLQIESAQWGRNFNLIPFALSDQRFIIAGLSWLLELFIELCTAQAVPVFSWSHSWDEWINIECHNGYYLQDQATICFKSPIHPSIHPPFILQSFFNH